MNTTTLSLPTLCFDRDIFLHKSNESANTTSTSTTSSSTTNGFHVEEFIASCRQRVSLETLLVDLQVFLKSLRNELVELINRDYADFVNLSSNLVGMDRVIGDIQAPLKQMREEVLLVQKTINESISSVQSKLDERASIREKKATLKLFLNISASLEKIEKLLSASEISEKHQLTSTTTTTSSSSSNTNSTDADDVNAASTRLIERVANEFNQLQFYVSQGNKLPFVQNLHSRISFITNTLVGSLEKAFSTALVNNDRSILIKCFRTYSLMDKVFDAEAIYRHQVVAPFLQQAITPANLNSQNGLELIFEKVLNFANEKVLPLHEIINESGSRGFNLLVNTLWPEVVHCLCNNISSIFAPAIPQNFHKNYTTTMNFVRNLEKKCGNQASVVKLREHESYRVLQDKWNLSVYFQLRFHEIASEFETVLQTQLLTPTALKLSDSNDFNLYTTQILWISILNCWSSSVYIDALCHRLWKLTLQILTRYNSWLKKEQECFFAQLTTPANGDTDSSIQFKSNFTGIESSIQGLILIVSDIELLVEKAPTLFETTLQPHLAQAFSSMDESQLKNLKDSFSECLLEIKTSLVPIGQNIISALIEVCVANLNPVRSVKSVYRMTNKEMPTKPSSYIPLIFKPMTSLLSTTAAASKNAKSVAQTQLFSQWMTQITHSVFQKMLEIFLEEIATVRKTEDSLNRLKKTRKTAATSASEITDTDKIQRQFQLDGFALQEQIESLGLSPIETDLNTFFQNQQALNEQ